MVTYKTVKFDKELLLDILDGNAEGYEIISNEIHDRRRWVVCYYLEFKEAATGKVYGVSYDVGATEQQEQSPWEFDGEEIPVHELQAFERTVVEYLPIRLVD